MNRETEKSNLYKFFLSQFEKELDIDFQHPEKIPTVLIEHTHNVVRVILDFIEMPNHKLIYILDTHLFVGMRDCFPHYGIIYTQKVHETLVEAVRQRLMDGADVEYEWSESQYNNFVVWKSEYEKR